jgi:membrane protein DedA with SNARE-associated domain
VLAVVVAVTVVPPLLGTRGLHALTQTLIQIGYLGAFLSGFLGTSSLMISFFPPQIVVFLMSAPQLGFNPLLLGISAGLGAGIAQYLHYYVGSAGRLLISEKQKVSMEKWKTRLDKYGPILILLFAVTPLTPDDLIWIPLGMMNYPKMKALVSAMLGKIIMLVICAYGGYNGMALIQKYLVAWPLRASSVLCFPRCSGMPRTMAAFRGAWPIL